MRMYMYVYVHNMNIYMFRKQYLHLEVLTSFLTNLVGGLPGRGQRLLWVTPMEKCKKHQFFSVVCNMRSKNKGQAIVFQHFQKHIAKTKVL